MLEKQRVAFLKIGGDWCLKWLRYTDSPSVKEERTREDKGRQNKTYKEEGKKENESLSSPFNLAWELSFLTPVERIAVGS